jgi:hypothetical protein
MIMHTTMITTMQVPVTKYRAAPIPLTARSVTGPTIRRPELTSDMTACGTPAHNGQSETEKSGSSGPLFFVPMRRIHGRHNAHLAEAKLESFLFGGTKRLQPAKGSPELTAALGVAV